MKFILKAHSSNEEWDGGCRFAVVDITPELARTLVGRIELLLQIKTTDVGLELDEMRYFEYVPDFWFSASPDHLPYIFNQVSEDLEELMEPLGQAQADFMALPDGLEIQKAFRARTDSDRTVVRADGVWFHCSPDNSGVDITSTNITLAMLRDLAR